MPKLLDPDAMVDQSVTLYVLGKLRQAFADQAVFAGEEEEAHPAAERAEARKVTAALKVPHYLIPTLTLILNR